MKQVKPLKLNILAISIVVTVLVAIVSRLFLPGLISWSETLIASVVSLLLCHLSTVIFVQKRKMVVLRYVFLVALVLSFIFFYQQKNNLVYRVPDDFLAKDSSIAKTTKLLIIGKKLKPEYVNKKSQKLNEQKNIPGLIKYLSNVEYTEIWIDYPDSRNRIVLSYVLLVIFLVALSTHLAEEIFLNIKQNKTSDIFISFNHQDEKIANIINNRLKKEGIKAILYSENPVIGNEIEASIRNWIKNTRITLALISKNSLLSGWVGKEINASIILEEFTDDRKFLVCKVDAIEFNSDLTNQLTDILKIELANYDAQLNQRTKDGMDTRDLSSDRSRIVNLIGQMNGIIQKLKSSIYSDLSSSRYEDELNKLVLTIKSYLKNN